MASKYNTEAGFSLLEIVVSLAVLSLASGVVMVNMMPLLDSRLNEATQTQLAVAIEQARLMSLSRDTPIALRKYLSENHPDLAKVVVVSENLLISTAGACQSGEIYIRHSDQEQAFTLQRLTCELHSVDH